MTDDQHRPLSAQVAAEAMPVQEKWIFVPAIGKYFIQNGKSHRVVEYRYLDHIDGCDGYAIWIEADND